MEVADSFMAVPGQAILELLAGQDLTVKRQLAKRLGADA